MTTQKHKKSAYEPVSSDNFQAFLEGIKEWLAPELIIRDKPRLIALATDASFYTKIPKLVIKVPSIHAMRGVLALANRLEIALTFRAAGTSLSGQAITDSVLVMLTPDWQQHSVLDNGVAISLAPGIIGAKANRILADYGRKIGPDPASINACKVGGIAANNASGMCCGVKNNSYHTLRHIHVILPDGSEVNTADAHSVAAFEHTHSDLLASLSALRDTLINNTALTEKVRYQYRLKNTMGYGLNALLDYENPLDIFTHLMIGSEGTLGFIANITYNTVPLPRARQTALYLFENFEAACAVIPALKACDVDAVELMDARALRAVAPLIDAVVASAETHIADSYSPDKSSPNKPSVENSQAVALLIDVGALSQGELDTRLNTVRNILTQPVSRPPLDKDERLDDGEGLDANESLNKSSNQKVKAQGHPLQDFTAEASIIEKLWNIRKGLFPAVGAVRPTGTTVIIEDVAFPLESLADGLNSLVALFEKHDYHDGIIFGHALDGNVHFVFSQGFNSGHEVARYQAFMEEISELVTKRFSGSLKAEHGTGRNMAPFLSAQWGDEGVALMRSLKNIIDPVGILNPGVILNDDPNAHITHLKPMPAVQDTVDACIECGFCEPQCPSLNYTLSPRQRIALKRRQTSLIESGADSAASEGVSKAFSHLAVDSCAATGLCANACPVGIDTGQWIKQIRGQSAHSSSNSQASTTASANFSGMNNAFGSISDAFAESVSNLAAKHTDKALSIARFTLNTGHRVKGIVGERALNHIADTLHLPRLHGAIPEAATKATFRGAFKSRFKSRSEGTFVGTFKGTGKSNPNTTTAGALAQKAQGINGSSNAQSKVVYMISCPSRVFGATKSNNKSKNEKSLVQAVTSLCDKANVEVIFSTADNLCCGQPWDSQGRSDTAIEKLTSWKQAAYELSEQGRWPVIIDNSACALNVARTITENTKHNKIKALEVSEYLLHYITPHLNVIKTSEPVMLHVGCSSTHIDKGNAISTLANLCATNVIIPSDITCCGFAGTKGFTTPELNKSALAPLALQVPEDCHRGVASSATCAIGLSQHSGVSYSHIAVLLDQISQPLL
ncbi:FAD-binding and (Fe-S)-binding domain-containing protein [Alteromonas sp. 1_MG-2023]|uniref:FAD-binding and (Fe-S)-binding domain-containing protein n=1 Tax=Alteromonas sp. 1_MG-2023 TaxID=3062669 RepID=UPI0026E44BE0|nr:FAD-binding and (Fe-S)-binding domain-containing protein [Alteromonas sp. 1_MG-2023]MDO6568965.1 FAD-binding and (Fe-S)-binding domain-containing protein [Alteromonas sp. 1_MG-2023]